MKYIRALDLLAAAAVFAKQGKVNSAAKSFNDAVNDKSIGAALKVIEASNKAAHKAAKVKANDQGIDADEPGEEFRVEVEENGDRAVQQAKSLRAKARALLAQADAMDGDDELPDDDENFLGADADEDGDLDIGDLDEGDDMSARVKASAAKPKSLTVNAAAFARAVRNIHALAK